ncbi:MAG: hypothetical protein M9887_03790 [Chitinophagales bacterium]|nr:hypothetical protein [Chitinophagales bacterium]
MKDKRVILFPWIIKKLVKSWTASITIFPFIFIRNEQLRANTILINHEKIHIRQQIEMLILLFYLWYVIEFLMKWIIYKSSFTAYQNISFEKEAYQNERNFNYIHTKKFWSFLKYL